MKERKMGLWLGMTGMWLGGFFVGAGVTIGVLNRFGYLLPLST
jgi:hypothetical protein